MQRVIRIIARLNVGGPAKHVVWLTSGLKDAGFDTLLVTGKVPEGEEDMSYFADEMGVTPRYFSEMSREISLNDAVTVWKLFRLYLARTARHRPHAHGQGRNSRTHGRFFISMVDAGCVHRQATAVQVCTHVSRTRLSQLLRSWSNAIYFSRSKDSWRSSLPIG